MSATWYIFVIVFSVLMSWLMKTECSEANAVPKDKRNAPYWVKLFGSIVACAMAFLGVYGVEATARVSTVIDHNGTATDIVNAFVASTHTVKILFIVWLVAIAVFESYDIYKLFKEKKAADSKADGKGDK